MMALEPVPADIRREGGVARMTNHKLIKEIMTAVTIHVFAKVRIGHFGGAQILQSLGVYMIDESEGNQIFSNCHFRISHNTFLVLSPADGEFHIDKNDYEVPFISGAQDLGEALRRIAVQDPHLSLRVF